MRCCFNGFVQEVEEFIMLSEINKCPGEKETKCQDKLSFTCRRHTNIYMTNRNDL